ncbi:AraC family transcriptional regulator [Robertmurraya yapensis]|uniref:AraC family transcriptional regulator n=2 Tax=Bacillaceae TaxID=186817 RepID=A0A3S0KER3_9BACI|nr:AraC family transcriptional regulator [Bacillus yapensis]RTR29153.1 AraC family transcriptional regulator [Bacillus yapensis]TKS94758.1 AraC family transcriptional regulator [Bacillus yapensis]
MAFMKVRKEFKVVGLKGSGEFINFGNEVPLLAKQVLSRANEILDPTETEIALFEPKRDEEHRIGQYYVGLIVNERLSKVPIGMDYMETNKSYVTTRGNISNLGELHVQLLNWSEEQGYQRDLDSYIVETYHPIGDGEEEVQIYLPIKS